MEANQYQQKRDELLELMNQVVKVEGLRDRDREFFLTTQRKLVENQFNIVLIGAYQGGKSTTFNAMCGGREISPRGASIKTSAICMTATNLSDPSKEEYAEVRWKSNSELRDTINEVIKFVPDVKSFDFDNKSDMDRLRDCIEEMRENSDMQEIVRIAQILVTFYENSELKNYCAKNQFRIEDVARIAVFPLDWETRWSEIHNIDDVKRLFKVEEVLFAFISDIQIYVHSSNLSRLGYSLTDCPGLFASQFDTQVAMNAIIRANAVIYLLGDTQIGEQDKKAIKEVMKYDALRGKVFFAMNQRKQKNLDKLISEDKAAIKNCGCGDVEIVDFNALLYFLSEFGKAKLSGKIDEYSLNRFKEVALNNGDIEKEEFTNIDIDQLWTAITYNCIFNIKQKKEADKIVGLDNESVCFSRIYSRCDNVIGVTEENIVSQKARSILIDSGAALVKNSLDTIAARLKDEEELINKSVEECENEYTVALQQYQSFKDDVEGMLDSYLPAEIITNCAEQAYYKLILESDLIDRIAEKIYNDINSFGFKGKAKLTFQHLKGKIGLDEDTEMKDKIKIIIESAIKSELEKDVLVWVSSMLKGEDDLYTINFKAPIENLIRAINLRWESISSQLLLGELHIESLDFNSTVNSIAIDSTEDISEAAISGVETGVSNIIKKIVSTIISTLVVAMVDIFLTGGVLTLIAGILTALFAGNKPDRTYEKIKESLQNSMHKKDKEKNLIDSLSECPRLIIEQYKKGCRTKLQEIEKTLQSSIEEKRNAKLESMETQRELVERAHSIRTEQIEPLSNQIDTFIQTCNC